MWRKATAQQGWGSLHSWPQSPKHGCQDSLLAQGIEVYILLSSPHFSYFKKSILCDLRMLVLCLETTLPMAVAPHKAPTFWAGIQGLHSLVLSHHTFRHRASALSQLLHPPAKRLLRSRPGASTQVHCTVSPLDGELSECRSYVAQSTFLEPREEMRNTEKGKGSEKEQGDYLPIHPYSGHFPSISSSLHT